MRIENLGLVSLAFLLLPFPSGEKADTAFLPSFEKARLQLTSERENDGDSGLSVTRLDGDDPASGFEIVDRGNGIKAVRIVSSGNYSIVQKDPGQLLNEQIAIGPNVKGRIELSGLNILSSSGEELFRESTIQVDPTSDVTLYFDGDNILRRNGNNYPAIGYYGNENAFTGSLTLEGSEEGSTYISGGLYASAVGGISEVVFLNEGGKENCDTVGPITVRSGNFEICAIGSGGSAIGSGTNGKAKEITIDGGNLVLEADGYKGSASGAVLGSADGGSCDGITINGGNLTISNASSSSSTAPAIGAGSSGECGAIVINGGNVYAESYMAPAIGLGLNWRTSASPEQAILINGGTVTAKANGGEGAAIGQNPSNPVPVSKIEINGGSVKSSLGKDPVNADGERLYLLKIDGAEGVESVDVGGKDFHVDSNHRDDSSLYLYVPGSDTEVDVADGSGKHSYFPKFIEEDGSFELVTTPPEPNQAPIIEAEDLYIELGTPVTDELLLQGVSVSDDRDEGLEARVLSHDVDSSAVGTYEVTYAAEDSGGLVSTKTVSAYVYANWEEINAVPTISGANREVEYGSLFDEKEALRGISAYDEEDKDLTSRIKVEDNPVDTSVPGTYEVVYSVSDSDGATSYLTIEVTVLEKPASEERQPPVITVDEIVLRVGDDFDELKALNFVSAVDRDGEAVDEIEVILNEVDTSKAGEYRIGFRATDKYGVSAEAYGTVEVIEREATAEPPEDGNGDALLFVLVPIGAALAIVAVSIVVVIVTKRRKARH